MIDTDSDHHVVKQLLPDGEELVKKLIKTMQWTDVMHHMMGVVHSKGHGPQVVQKCLAEVKMPADMLEALRYLKQSPHCETVIISDANNIFIEEILQANNVRHLIDHIITNKAVFDDQGRMHITRYLAETDPPHGCKIGTCAVNMCKGKELEAYLYKQAISKDPKNVELLNSGKTDIFTDYQQVMYVGDGRNDFCPITRLRPTDTACVRKNRDLENILKSRCQPVRGRGLIYEGRDDVAIQADVVFWDKHDTILELFKNKIQ